MSSELHPSFEQSIQPPLRLYDLRALDIATFLSSWFAGGFLLARNLRALDRHDDARNALLFGFLALFPLAFAIYSIVVPEQYERALGAAVQGLQVAAVHLVASRVHGEELEAHRRSGGRFHSRWRAAGISLLLLPIIVIVLLAVGMAFPDLPGLR